MTDFEIYQYINEIEFCRFGHDSLKIVSMDESSSEDRIVLVYGDGFIEEYERNKIPIPVFLKIKEIVTSEKYLFQFPLTDFEVNHLLRLNSDSIYEMERLKSKQYNDIQDHVFAVLKQGHDGH